MRASRYGGHLVLSDHMTAGALTSFLLYSIFTGCTTVPSYFFLPTFPRQDSISGIIDNQSPVSEKYDGFTTATSHSCISRIHFAKMWMWRAYEEMLNFRTLASATPGRCDQTRQACRTTQTCAISRDLKILNNMSLSVGAGQVVGVVGSSGSGKSTLGVLLTRLYDPQAMRFIIPMLCEQTEQEGKILVDGMDISKMNPACLRTIVGVVPQMLKITTGCGFVQWDD
eukprot:24868-Hanusia_phi.AAC.1